VFRRTTARLCAIVAIAAAMLIATAGVALAAPVGDPTLGLTALQAKLDASPSGTIAGYMKTVLKGSQIETIPVEVKAISGDTAASSLILFEAQGPKIAAFGGIVAGMSGSPIYVDDGGVDKVIGALSYGDVFTIGGSGLATPIESMLSLYDKYTPRVSSLSSPVLMSGRIVDKIIVPTNPEAYTSPSQAGGAFVAKPLSSIYIGGVNPKSRMFADLKKKIEAHGQSVVALDTGLSAGSSSFSTTLSPGAAISALYTRGDLWIGGIGTVTYAQDDTLLAFGHPLDWTGDTSMYLTNALITGVWPSSYEPYKMGYPTAIRGEFTQDRTPGELGIIGALPAEVPVTASAVDADTGDEATSTVHLTGKLVDSGDTSYYVSEAALMAGYKLYDQYDVPGSALTTTTIVVGVGTDRYTVTIPNMVDDASDLSYQLADDVDYAISSLLSVRSDGLEVPHIVSVDLASRITVTPKSDPAHGRRAARIVGVKPETSLKVGANRIKVSLLAVGVAATQTVDATITIPVGTPVSGVLSASGNSSWASDYSDYIDYGIMPTDAPAARATVASTVRELNGTLPANSVTVDFYPASVASTMSDDGNGSTDATVSVEGTATTPWVTSDSAQMTVTELTAHTKTVSRGSDAFVYGEIYGPEKPMDVSVYATPAGATEEELVATDTASVDPETGDMTYEVYLPMEFYTNTQLRVHIDGGVGYTAADTYVTQLVRASVKIGTSSKSVKHGKKVTLTASVAPGTSTGTVTFQYYNSSSRSWRKIVARTLTTGSSYAKATTSWAVPKGSRKVRVVYGGCTANAGNTSSSVTIVGK
jgi:hypothetical protein